MVSVSGRSSSFTFSVPDGARAGDVATMVWHHAKSHTGWFFLEDISGGPSPNYTVSGPGSGSPCNNSDPNIAAKKADYAGTGGTSQLTLQDALIAGAIYRIKTYLCDNDYGTADEAQFTMTAGPGGAGAAAATASGTNGAAVPAATGGGTPPSGTPTPASPVANDPFAGFTAWTKKNPYLALGGALALVMLLRR